MINEEKVFLTTKEMAIYLGLSPSTLAIWRCTKACDLPFIKVGGRIRYCVNDVKAWLQKH